jgi:transcriptional regulator with XRE-family HTH domain
MPYPKERRVVHPLVAELKQERLRRGLSLVKLQQMTGYTNQHLWQIEVGQQGVRVDVLDNIAHALGMKLRLDRDDD